MTWLAIQALLRAGGSFVAAHWRTFALVAIIFAALTWVHHRGYEAGAAKQHAVDAQAIAQRDQRIAADDIALQAANDALAKQNAEADKEILQAKQAQADADRAAEVALQAQDAAQRRLKSYDRELRDARQHPGCAALLDADIAKECGL